MGFQGRRGFEDRRRWNEVQHNFIIHLQYRTCLKVIIWLCIIFPCRQARRLAKQLHLYSILMMISARFRHFFNGWQWLAKYTSTVHTTYLFQVVGTDHGRSRRNPPQPNTLPQCRHRIGNWSKSGSRRTTPMITIAGNTSCTGRTNKPGRSRKDEFEFAAKVLIEPAVEERIGAGGWHPKEMASGVDYEHHFFVPWKFKWVVEIESEIKNVQRKPSDGEDEGNGHQKAMTSTQALLLHSKLKLIMFKLIWYYLVHIY